jgi:hypothetical protein
MDEHEWITKYRKLVLELVDIVHTADFLTLDERHGLVSLGLYQLGIEARWSDPETMSEWMGDFNQLVVHPAFVKAKMCNVDGIYEIMGTIDSIKELDARDDGSEDGEPQYWQERMNQLLLELAIALQGSDFIPLEDRHRLVSLVLEMMSEIWRGSTLNLTALNEIEKLKLYTPPKTTNN